MEIFWKAATTASCPAGNYTGTQGGSATVYS